MRPSLPNLVIREIRPFLKASGFELESVMKQFQRQHPDRLDIFDTAIVNDRPGFRLQPAVGIRYSEVESIYHRTSGKGPGHHNDTRTVGVLFSHIYERGYDIVLRTTIDVPSAAARMIDIFNENAIPFFDRFRTLEAIDAELNGDPLRRSEYCASPIRHASVGVIVAYLIGRRNLSDLAASYYSLIAPISNGFYIPQFAALLADLGITLRAGANR